MNHQIVSPTSIEGLRPDSARLGLHSLLTAADLDIGAVLLLIAVAQTPTGEVIVQTLAFGAIVFAENRTGLKQNIPKFS